MATVKIVIYLKDGRVAAYPIRSDTLEEAHARGREHAHRIVNFGFRFDFTKSGGLAGNTYVGPGQVDKCDIEGVPAGKYRVEWRNL